MEEIDRLRARVLNETATREEIASFERMVEEEVENYLSSREMPSAHRAVFTENSWTALRTRAKPDEQT